MDKAGKVALVYGCKVCLFACLLRWELLFFLAVFSEEGLNMLGRYWLNFGVV